MQNTTRALKVGGDGEIWIACNGEIFDIDSSGDDRGFLGVAGIIFSPLYSSLGVIFWRLMESEPSDVVRVWMIKASAIGGLCKCDTLEDGSWSAGY